MKVLVLGHGRWLWNYNHLPRCCCCSKEHWDKIKEYVICIDNDIRVEPDILMDITKPWVQIESESIDEIIFAGGLLCDFLKQNTYDEILRVLKNDGIYYGKHRDKRPKHLYNGTYKKINNKLVCID